MDSGTQELLPEGAKARRVYLSLRDQITGGALGAGDALPGEQRLAESYGVSRVTVRRALDAMAGNGLIDRRAGSGTRVRAGAVAERPVAMNFSSLMPQLVEMSHRTQARLLSFSYGTPPEQVARALTLEEGETVQIATRVRSADGTPFSYLTTYVPTQIARNYSEDDLANNPLFALLERSGVEIDQAHQSVSATLAGPEVATALEVTVGTALLSLSRVVKDVQGHGVEYLSGLYRPDMFRLEMPLERVGKGAARHWEPAIGHQDGGTA